jgi:hypothetical protein
LFFFTTHIEFSPPLPENAILAFCDETAVQRAINHLRNPMAAEPVNFLLNPGIPIKQRIESKRL